MPVLCLVTHLHFFTPNPAQRFAADSKVRSDIVLTGLLLNIGMLFMQFFIAQIWGLGTQENCPFLAHNIILLYNDPAQQIALRKICIISVQLLPADRLQFTILKYFYVFMSWFLGEKAVNRDHQIPLSHKPGGALFAIFINEIGT